MEPAATVPNGALRHEQGLYVEDDFYDHADSVYAEIEPRLPSSRDPGAFTSYVGARAFNFLSAPIERVLSRDRVGPLVGTLSAWAKDLLNAHHVSTPQLRVYADGGGRALLRDDVDAAWHYVLSLTRSESASEGLVTVLVEELGEASRRELRVSVARTVRLRLSFNRLLVHSASSPYAIERSRYTNPREATVFLEGYLW